MQSRDLVLLRLNHFAWGAVMGAAFVQAGVSSSFPVLGVASVVFVAGIGTQLATLFLMISLDAREQKDRGVKRAALHDEMLAFHKEQDEKDREIWTRMQDACQKIRINDDRKRMGFEELV